MGIFDIFKPITKTDKKSEKPKPKAKEEEKEKDPNELTNPGKPTADTINLVSIAAIYPPYLLTKEGGYVLMLEIPEMDMDVTGATEAALYQGFETALGALPPGTSFQMTIFEEPVDPSVDLEYFYNNYKKHKDSIEYKDPDSNEYRQGEALSISSLSMLTNVAKWYDNMLPIRRRTVITLYYLPGAVNVARNIAKGQYAEADLEQTKKEFDKVNEIMAERLDIIQHAFSGGGIPLTVLSPEEACRVVWRTMHPISPSDPDVTAADIAVNLAQGQKPFKKEAPEASEFTTDLTGEQIAGMVGPDYVIERPDMLEIDNVLMRGYVVYDFRANRPTYLYRLASLSGGWVGTLFIDVMDPAVAADKLSQRETQLTAQEIVKERQGVLMDFSVHQEVGAVQESRMLLETQGQAPINICFFLFRTALTKKVLDDRCREMETLFKTIGVAAFEAKYTQTQLWRSYVPLGIMWAEQKRRNMDAPSLSSFYWPQRWRYNEDGGVYVGIDNTTSLPLFLDPFGERGNKTPTFLAIGRPGAGKTVWLRTMMTSSMINGGRVMAVDIEGEMKEYCDYYGGRYIEVGTKKGELINVLDIPLDADDPLAVGTEQLVSFCEAVRGAPIPQGPEWNALAEAYKSTLIDRGWLEETGPNEYTISEESWTKEDAPRLGDVAQLLERSTDPTANSLHQMLLPYVSGVYSNYFNKATTFNIRDERLVIFGLKNVNAHSSSNQLRVYLWQILGLMWSEVLNRFNADKKTANNVMLDEVWALLKSPNGAQAIENMARRFRKRRAGLWLATQEVGEFLDSPDAKKILSIVGNTFLMDQRPMEARLLQQILSLPDNITSLLVSQGTGRGMMITPDRTMSISVVIPPEWHSY